MTTTISTAMSTNMTTTMTEAGAPVAMAPEALLALGALASPAYPVGAFSHSHGVEWAIGAGEIADAASLESWIGDCLDHGAGRSDAILMAEAWRRAAEDDEAGLRDLNDLALALTPSAGRRLESAGPGTAFRRTTLGAWSASPTLQALPAEAAYPVVFGAAAAVLGAPAPAAALLLLQGVAANLVSVGVRLIPIGQTDGQRILAALAPRIARLAEHAVGATLDEIGAGAMRSDLASMKQETMAVRLFRS